MHAASTRYPSCRAVLAAEYGSSKNPMTPDVITVGGVLDGPRPWAAEIASGSGILPGTVLVGVSVVTVNEDGTTSRQHDLSRCFSGTDINALIDEALDYMRTLDDRVKGVTS